MSWWMREKGVPRLTEQGVDLLRRSAFDDSGPGAIVHDFEAYLDFIGPQGLAAGGKRHLPAISALEEINARMRLPFRVQLERPQLRSFPNVQGLHLLARATGLVIVQGEGSKAKLVVDPAALESWRSLNAAEKYFSLLDAFVIHAAPETAGVDRLPLGDEYLPYMVFIWTRIGGKGKHYTQKQRSDPNETFGLDPERYTLALMALFGFVEIEQGKPITGRAWFPVAVRQLPLGAAVLGLMATRSAELLSATHGADPGFEDELDESEMEPDDAPSVICFDHLQPLFHPDVPAWNNSLCVPIGEFREGVFVFKVSVGKAWRRIAAPADATLDDLATAILKSVKFDFDHLWSFYFHTRFGNRVEVTHPYSAAEVDLDSTDETLVGQLPLEPGQSMEFLYDFGDEWRFNLKLERIDPPDPKLKRPKLMESHDKPPEQYPDWVE